MAIPYVEIAGGIRRILEIIFCLVYAYQHTPTIQTRKMANPEHLALLKQGVTAWNEWCRSKPGIGSALISAEPHRANLEGADLRGADLRRVDLRGVDLRDATLEKADLRGAILYDATLEKADLRGANLRGANLSSANLRGATLFQTNLKRANLERANLEGANLERANLEEVDLRGADLRGADLRGADLRSANLHGANLSSANLRGVVLSSANLRGVVLSSANLRGVVLSSVNLRGADLDEARLQETIFSDTNLAGVTGLDTCDHLGPSTLDFRTLQQSGPLPLVFLRGCGLPDLLIDSLPSLLDPPIQYYSCFISYSNKDEDFARRLHADLQDEGVRCWFAPEDIKGGRKIRDQIGEAIQLHEKLLLVLSEHSMNSEWVKTEIAKARQREVREKRQVLFPIRLVDLKTIQQWECFDAETGKDSAKEVREYFILDFSNYAMCNFTR